MVKILFRRLLPVSITFALLVFGAAQTLAAIVGANDISFSHNDTIVGTVLVRGAMPATLRQYTICKSTAADGNTTVYRYTEQDGGKWYDAAQNAPASNATAITLPSGITITHELYRGEFYEFDPTGMYNYPPSAPKPVSAHMPGASNSPPGLTPEHSLIPGSSLDDTRALSSSHISAPISPGSTSAQSASSSASASSDVNSSSRPKLASSSASSANPASSSTPAPSSSSSPVSSSETATSSEPALNPYKVEFTGTASDGTNLAFMNQLEVRVTKDGNKVDGFTIVLYDAGGGLINFSETVNVAGGIGYICTVMRAEYDYMDSYAIFEKDRVDEFGNTTGSPLIAGRK